MASRAGSLAILIGALCAGFVGGWSSSLLSFFRVPPPEWRAPKAVRAEAFEAVDERGRVFAVLSARGLDILDERGIVRATLRLSYNSNGLLGFSTAKWEGRMVVGFLGTDTPAESDDNWGLVIHEPHDFRRIVAISTSDDGTEGSISVRTAQGWRTLSDPEAK